MHYGAWVVSDVLVNFCFIMRIELTLVSAKMLWPKLDRHMQVEAGTV